MDTVHVQGITQAYRLLPKPARVLSLLPIKAEETGYKLCKITGKKTAVGGKIQLSLHDGRNLLLDAKTASIYEKGLQVEERCRSPYHLSESLAISPSRKEI